MQQSIETYSNKIFAGYGVVDITPPVGEFCSFRLAPNKRSLGVHDPLFAKVFYLHNGAHSLCMVSVDTGMVSELIDRQSFPDLVLEHDDRCKPDGHGSLLQDVQTRGAGRH